MTSTGIDYETSRVIMLGTSAYDNSKFRNVPAVEHSMRGMYSMLTHPRYGGWPEDRVEYWLNRGKSADVSLLLRTLARSTEGVLIFYFVGHGTMTEDQELCLMLPDTTDDDPDLTGLEFRQVSRALGASNALTKIVILDCCYADSAIGNLATDDAPAFESTPGMYTLTATNRLQQRARWSGRDDGTPTAFTGELLDLIHAGKAGGPERLSLDDFYPILRKQLIGLDLPKPDNVASDMAIHQPFTLNAAHPSLHGNGITAPPFVAAQVDPPGPGAGQSPRAAAQGASRQVTGIGNAAFQRASRRISGLAPRTRRIAAATLAALCLAAAVLIGYALKSGTSTQSPTILPTAPPNLHLSNVYAVGSGAGSSSYAFLPNDHADQAFRSAMPYIDRVGVIVGLDPRNQRSNTHTLEIQVLDAAGKILGQGFAALVNNANTTIILPDIRTYSDETYHIRVWNRSEDVLGIYLNKPASASTNVGLASIDGTSQPGIIAGFVEGRNLPTS